MGKILTSYNSNDNVMTIKVVDTFNLSVVKNFRQAYEGHDEVKKYLIDLSQVSYMDSSGLGSILVMHEDVTQRHPDAKISIINVPDDIKLLFKCINLKQLKPELQLDYSH